MGILDALIGKRASREPEPRDDIERAVWTFARDARSPVQFEGVARIAEGQAILSAPPDAQVRAVHFCFAILDWLGDEPDENDIRGHYMCRSWILALATELLARPLPVQADDLSRWLQGCQRTAPHLSVPKAVVKTVGAWLEGRPVAGKLAAALREFQEFAHGPDSNAEFRKLGDRFEKFLRGEGDDRVLDRVDAWTSSLLDALAVKKTAVRADWFDLLSHAAKATSAKPSQSWLQTAQVLVEKLGRTEMASTLSIVLASIGAESPVSIRVPFAFSGYLERHPTVVADKHSDALRGLVWTASLVGAPDLISALGDAAERCFKKIPGHGPRSPKIGNACLWALSHVDTNDAIGQLSRIGSRAKHASSRRQVEKSLEVAAERSGLSRADLEDVAVPTCGLTSTGILRETIADYVVELELTDCRSTRMRWTKPGGRPQASAPAALKTAFADELKRLKKTEKDIQQLLLAQRDRVERMLVTRRALPFKEWKRRYVDHPLVGYLAERLIWRFGDAKVCAIPRGDALVRSDGSRLSPLDGDAVTIWHPIESSTDEVLAWRDWLSSHDITQPFKQAHREIYVLTDAERRTEIYSNRFASHILKQHQFAALCRQRGWHYTLQGAWDSHNVPFIELAELGYRVEFRVDPAGDPAAAQTSDAGIYVYISTDQVRFHRLNEGPQVLDRVPPVLFSELMRDVDLFVGVCSAGNDPHWVDGGANAAHAAYWRSFAFGDLGESAKMRRAILERLVPKLKIADRCSFEDRFLVVRGDLRTYRIHLGSANILMDPDDQYLCIVPSPSKRGTGNVMLPFEGDGTLALIISKALLLADDKRIEDPTIVTQIQRR